MDGSVVVGAVGLLSSGLLGTLGYRLGRRSQRIAEQQHHEDRRPRLAIRSHRLNGAGGAPHVAVVLEAGPDLAAIELTVLPPLAGSRSAGKLMETGQGTEVDVLVMAGSFRPGDEVMARVALQVAHRGTDLRLRVTCRAGRPRPWWRLRTPPDEEWGEVATIAFPHPASIQSPVGTRIPRPGRGY